MANAPWSVNLISNTGEQAAGLLGAPITLLFGPVTTYVALLTFAFSSSATAAYVLLRRWTRWRLAAFIGGAMYGFSPYMIGHGQAHLNLVLVPVPPLIICVLDQLLVRRRGRPEILGLLLAALVVVQCFISSEILTITAIVCVIGLVTAAVLAPASIVPSLGPLVRCGSVMFVALLALLAYPLWFGLHGAGHITGPIQLTPEGYRADLSATVVPSPLQAISPAWTRHLSAAFVSGDEGENGAYLGFPLLILLLVTSVLLWRRRFIVRWAAIVLAACWLLSLGSRLTVSGVASAKPTGGFPLPEALFNHIPLVMNLLPLRFTLFVGLFAGVLLAVAADALAAPSAEHSAAPSWRRWIALTVPVLSLIPLIPALPYAATTIATPAYFTSSAVDAVPPDSTVLLYPFPGYSVDNAAPMIWQADSFLRFRIVGGYFQVPKDDGRVTAGRTTATSDALNNVYHGLPVPRSPAERRVVRAQLASWHVTVVLADPSGPAGRRGVSFLAWLVGRPPVLAHGVAAWYRTGFPS